MCTDAAEARVRGVEQALQRLVVGRVAARDALRDLRADSRRA